MSKYVRFEVFYPIVNKVICMLVDVKDFVEKIDQKFWNHITKQAVFRDIVDYKDISREDFLRNLATSLNNFEHSFNKPDYFYAPKDEGILRKTKVHNLQDTCIYYYCVKSIQDELSAEIKKNPNVFGGFRMTPDLDLTDEDLDRLSYDPRYESSLAKNKYRKEWGNYQKLALGLANRNFDKYVHLDIAHFYDDVNLGILENRVKSVVQGKPNILDILFHFLKYSDMRDLGYFPSSVGVPQEELGDMSRLLANFYLAQFDSSILKILEEMFPAPNGFVYTRYADDLWFCFNGDKEDMPIVIQRVSLELQRLKLHLNEKKIEVFDSNEFKKYWHFEQWEKMYAYKMVFEWDLDLLFQLHKDLLSNQVGRWFSLDNYVIKVITSRGKNVSVISNKVEAEEFISGILNTPKMVGRFSDEHREFFIELLRNYPALKTILKEYLSSKRNIYPSVEFFVLEILACSIQEIEDIDFFVSTYFDAVKPYQWYSRCICIRTLFENIAYLEKDRKDKLKKIIKHMGDSGSNQSFRERRYSIRFLLHLRDNRGQETLAKYFAKPDDLSFLNHLKD